METINRTTKNPDGTLTTVRTVPALITMVEAGRMLGISRQVAIKLVKDGHLEGVDREGHTMVRSHDVLDLRTARLKRQRQSALELMSLVDELESGN